MLKRANNSKKRQILLNICEKLFYIQNTVWWIGIVSMQIRIQLSTSMRIRILLLLKL
jgi:hypothetical protein